MSHRNQRQKDTCYPKILSPQKKKQTLETKWHFSEEKKEKRKKKTWGLVGNKSSSQTLEEDPQQSKKDEATFFLAQLCSCVPKTSQKVHQGERFS